MIEERKKNICDCGEELQEYFKKPDGVDNGWNYLVFKRCPDCLTVFFHIEKRFLECF